VGRVSCGGNGELWQVLIHEKLRKKLQTQVRKRIHSDCLEALCLKNSADRLKNVFNDSGRGARFRGDDIIFVGENWWDKIDWIPKDRSRLLTDFLFKPSPN